MIQSVSILPSSLPQNPQKLTILPLSDLHLPKDESQIILANRAYLERADFVVLLGDMVRCYGTDAEYGAVRDFTANLNRPYTAICGNHEWYFEEFDEISGIYGEVWAQASNENQRAQQEKFRAFYGADELWRSFSTSLGHFVFLSLDEVESQKQEALSEQQLHFLWNEVENAGKKPLFVFCHAPLMLRNRLDMVYYEESRSGCVELEGRVRDALERRAAPTFWMSGHVHLHPDHPLFAPYRCGGNVWQIHCPDSWGYGRWNLSQYVPARYEGLFSRHLEIDAAGVSFVTHNHRSQSDREIYRVDF
ncbi:Calcineurin-like phosphoesterase [Abditibacterium utsteinense]|uniref:Calcineurin-like phosphoesterase n=1 Tax=Abditibacterium utsteinense TaxID=1960156 RepID=A0A2S8STU9_9BACT|nr:metallophosphoesterase [Abditibacterium utsteinense]PQV64232.1 Calcineurin-like phosphoesterase [Abditibacterium utsteinense]